MKWWQSYKNRVTANILGFSEPEVKGVAYWRDRLFMNVVTYLLPVSLLALVPGVVMSVVGGIPMLALFDILAAVGLAVVVLHPRIPLFWRKALVVTFLYLLSFVLLLYLGSFGPGLLYLLTLTFFIALIFPITRAYWSVAANVLLCLVLGVVIHFQLFDSPLSQVYSLGSWVAVAVNLVLLSVMSVAGLQVLFNGLQATLQKEEQLQLQLRQESKNLQRMLEEMEVKNQELEQFAFVASHDLQEPLQTISGLVDLMGRQFAGVLGPEGGEHLTFVRQLSERMAALITGLLTYSRIGRERVLEEKDCQRLLEEVLADMQVTIQATHASIEVGPLPTLPVYPIEFKLLFQNLISNALKFRKAGVPPQVRVRAWEEEDYHLFSVADNGIGIEPQHQEKIFVIFQRLHPRSRYEGTGIGLAHCKKIVELHGGKIWVDATLGEGSVFTFKIPKG